MKPLCLVPLLLCACTGEPADGGEPEPPTRKEIIGYLLDAHDVELSIDPSCEGVGSDFDDATIGDYVSGLLAEQVDGDGKNWIETQVVLAQPATAADAREWIADVTFRRQDGEEEWGWGVEFRLSIDDPNASPYSFRCIGGG